MAEFIAVGWFACWLFLPIILVDVAFDFVRPDHWSAVEVGAPPKGRGPSRRSNSAAGSTASPARRHLNQEESNA